MNQPKKNKDPIIVNRKNRTYQIATKKSTLPEDIQTLMQARQSLATKIDMIAKRLAFFQSAPLEDQLHSLEKKDIHMLATITDKLIALPKKK